MLWLATDFLTKSNTQEASRSSRSYANCSLRREKQLPPLGAQGAFWTCEVVWSPFKRQLAKHGFNSKKSVEYQKVFKISHKHLQDVAGYRFLENDGKRKYWYILSICYMLMNFIVHRIFTRREHWCWEEWTSCLCEKEGSLTEDAMLIFAVEVSAALPEPLLEGLQPSKSQANRVSGRGFACLELQANRPVIEQNELFNSQFFVSILHHQSQQKKNTPKFKKWTRKLPKVCKVVLFQQPHGLVKKNNGYTHLRTGLLTHLRTRPHLRTFIPTIYSLAHLDNTFNTFRPRTGQKAPH